MALDRNAKYPGRYDAPTPEQPQGAFKNRTAAGSNDGSYLERDWLNDWSGFFSSVLAKVGFTPNGNVDEVGASQYFDAMELGRPVENRFKGNQNWNVEGSTGDPLPSATPTLYTVGAKIVAGVEVITTNADQITYVSGVLNSGNNTGILRRRYAKDDAGLITKSTQYGGIKLPDGSQLQALVDDIATNGVRITEDGTDVVVDVDLSVITGGFRFFGLSDESGAWADINDFESRVATGIPIRKDLTGTRILDTTYTNTGKLTREVVIRVIQSGGSIIGVLTVNNGLLHGLSATGLTGSASQTITAEILPNESYSFTLDNGVVSAWQEIEYE